jgi:uncharacterized protein YciI
MIYAILSTDRPDGAELRHHTRPIHRDWLRGEHEMVRLLMSGATLQADGQTMNGSLVIVEANSLQDVETFAQADPYRHAGLFERWEIRPWDWTYGNPAGTPSINPL